MSVYEGQHQILDWCKCLICLYGCCELGCREDLVAHAGEGDVVLGEVGSQNIGREYVPTNESGKPEANDIGILTDDHRLLPAMSIDSGRQVVLNISLNESDNTMLVHSDSSVLEDI